MILNNTYPITKSGIFIEDFDEHEYKYITKRFTLPVYDEFTKYETNIKLYKHSNGRIIVPRFGMDVDTISYIKKGDKKNFQFTGKLNDYQTKIYEYLIENIYNKENIKSGKAGCILAMPAGSGKTYLPIALSSYFKRKVAYICHNKSILSQVKKTLESNLTIDGKPINIGYYYSDEKKDGDIVLLIINSASKDEFIINNKKFTAIEYFNQFGFIIYDECHLYINEKGIKTFKQAQAPAMIGLSATPDENVKKLDKIIRYYLGKVIYPEKIINVETVIYNITVNRIIYKCHKENAISDEYYSNNITKLNSDKYRNQLIINCLFEAKKLGLNVYIFSDRREHLLQLKDLINEQLTDYKNICIMGGSDDTDMEIANEESDIILSTYDYMGTGRSIVKMNGLIFATPRKNKIKQFIGRIHRLGSDPKITRYVWDIIDPPLIQQSRKRLSFYKDKHSDKIFTIINRKISYDEIEFNEKKQVNVIWD